jgi:hypothetical protein
MVLLSGFVFSFLLEKRREVRDDAGLTAWNSATHPFKRCQHGNMLSGAKDLAFERHWTTLSLKGSCIQPSDAEQLKPLQDLPISSMGTIGSYTW